MSTAFSLFTADGSRGVDVRVRDGLAYYVEREHVAGTIWKDREGRPEFGPYDSPEAAEARSYRESLVHRGRKFRLRHYRNSH